MYRPSLGLLFVLFASAISGGLSAKILGIFHMPSYSHFVLGETLLKELARRGHQVTMISSFPQKTTIKNYRDIPLEILPEIFAEKKRERNMFDAVGMPVFLVPFLIGAAGLEFTEAVFQEPAVQDLLHSDEKFDLVISEQFINDAFKGFAEHFNASSVILSTIGSGIWTNHLVGNPQPFAYAPDLFLSYSSKMTFLQRVANTLFITLENLYYHLYFFGKQNQLLRKYIPNSTDLNEIMYNTSLVLLNSHVSCNPPLPHVPGMVEVGGLHIEEAPELPADLKRYLDDSKQGAVFFSLGSNLNAGNMSRTKIEKIMNVISRIRLNVLWKFEDDSWPNLPKNLMIGKWFPQQSILAHPNLKLFITHGGLLSTMEAVYYGVPVLGIPIFGDQKMNMAMSDELGYSITIQYGQLDETNFYQAINELLVNPKYSKNAKLRSKVIRDRPLKPLDDAVYWVEYVLRHKGAPHLRSKALDLQWYQHLLLDVIVFLIATLIVVITTINCFVKYVLNKKRRSKTKQQ